MCLSRPESRHSRDGPGSQAGLTMMEMVLFIVIIGVLGAALFSAISNPLTGAGTQERAVFTTQLAQERMEVVLGQKRREGFPGSDPCDGGASLDTCSVPSGFSVNTTFGAWSQNSDTDNYRVITVTVTSPSGGSYSAHTLVTKLGGS